MIQYWTNLNERERLLGSLGALILIIYLFYRLIYAPLSGAVHNKSLELLEKQSTLSWMKEVQQQIKKEIPLQRISNAKLLSLIDNQLREGDLKQFAYQLQQTNTGEIQLSFEKVPFNSLLNWLWKLQNHFTITLKQLNAEKVDLAGMTKLNLIISTATAS